MHLCCKSPQIDSTLSGRNHHHYSLYLLYMAREAQAGFGQGDHYDDADDDEDDEDDVDLLLLDGEASREVEAGMRRVWIFQATSFSRVDPSQQRVLRI